MEDFVINVGPAKFINSTMRKLFNAGRIEGGCNELFKWKYGRVKGIMVVINGLLRRRTAEYTSCIAGLS
jgi:lysozyme